MFSNFESIALSSSLFTLLIASCATANPENFLFFFDLYTSNPLVSNSFKDLEQIFCSKFFTFLGGAGFPIWNLPFLTL